MCPQGEDNKHIVRVCCMHARTSSQVREHRPGRLGAALSWRGSVPCRCRQPAGGAAHEQRRGAAGEALEGTPLDVLLAAAVAAVDEQLAAGERCRQLSAAQPGRARCALCITRARCAGALVRPDTDRVLRHQ